MFALATSKNRNGHALGNPALIPEGRKKSAAWTPRPGARRITSVAPRSCITTAATDPAVRQMGRVSCLGETCSPSRSLRMVGRLRNAVGLSMVR
jgi:hypothetical protein